MFKENKDYLARKIIIYIFSIDLFIIFASAIMMLVNNYQKSAYLENVSEPILIIGISLAIVFFAFCVVEIALKNRINKKIKQFINNKDFNKGIDYIKKLPKIKVFYDIYESQLYYLALLNLYLDNIENAKNNFYNIDINSSIIDTGVFVNTTLYMLLICHEENCQSQDRKLIEECFNRNIKAVRKNRNQYKKLKIV